MQNEDTKKDDDYFFKGENVSFKYHQITFFLNSFVILQILYFADKEEI